MAVIKRVIKTLPPLFVAALCLVFSLAATAVRRRRNRSGFEIYYVNGLNTTISILNYELNAFNQRIPGFLCFSDVYGFICACFLTNFEVFALFGLLVPYVGRIARQNLFLTGWKEANLWSMSKMESRRIIKRVKQKDQRYKTACPEDGICIR